MLRRAIAAVKGEEDLSILPVSLTPNYVTRQTLLAVEGFAQELFSSLEAVSRCHD
ncbi:hypothetical protein [Mycobacterium attenuatum]|uniref:hypothetical protein n=1 Tax=Mycobacterium attenuatum TaxID=2341086 RepID=UPI00145A00DF|nr:hypothetical protein [Mycobacterium attenuatum]